MDPGLDGTSDIPSGLRIARNFLKEVIDLGVPTATELLDPIHLNTSPTWYVGPRSAPAPRKARHIAKWPPAYQCHSRFKNGTDGGLGVAINAIKAASQQQTFLGIDNQGQANAITTSGNPNCHIVLRGVQKDPTTAPTT